MFTHPFATAMIITVEATGTPIHSRAPSISMGDPNAVTPYPAVAPLVEATPAMAGTLATPTVASASTRTV